MSTKLHWSVASTTFNCHAVSYSCKPWYAIVLTRADASSSHPAVQYRSLDWSDALGSNVTVLQSFLEEVQADIVLGADLVRFCQHRGLKTTINAAISGV